MSVPTTDPTGVAFVRSRRAGSTVVCSFVAYSATLISYLLDVWHDHDLNAIVPLLIPAAAYPKVAALLSSPVSVAAGLAPLAACATALAVTIPGADNDGLWIFVPIYCLVASGLSLGATVSLDARRLTHRQRDDRPQT